MASSSAASASPVELLLLGRAAIGLEQGVNGPRLWFAQEPPNSMCREVRRVADANVGDESLPDWASTRQPYSLEALRYAVSIWLSPDHPLYSAKVRMSGERLQD